MISPGSRPSHEEAAMPELVFFRQGEEVLRVALERQRLVLGRAEDR